MASAGEAAIELLNEGAGFQVIISDYFLEGSSLTGLDILKFCTSQKNPTPFIIFSGRSADELQAALGSNKSVPIVSKVLPLKEIRNKFAELLRPLISE